MLAGKVRMPAPSPQTAREETPLHILLRKLDPRSRPLVLVVNARTLMCLIRVLLVIRDELERERDEAQRREYIVRNLQRAVFQRDDRGVVCRDREEEEKDILDDGDECEVEDLEKPGRDLLAEDFPAVIFIFATRECISDGFNVSCLR